MAEKKEEKALPRKLRGVATIDEQYGVIFKPYAEGEPRKEDIKKARQSTMYVTQGDKKKSSVCHLTVDAGSVDPVGEMLQDFCHLTNNDVVDAYAAARGKLLLQTNNLHITANRAKRVINVVMTIDVEKTPNYEKTVFNLFQEILKCFTFNRTYLASLHRAQKKNSCD